MPLRWNSAEQAFHERQARRVVLKALSSEQVILLSKMPDRKFLADGFIHAFQSLDPVVEFRLNAKTLLRDDDPEIPRTAHERSGSAHSATTASTLPEVSRRISGRWFRNALSSSKDGKLVGHVVAIAGLLHDRMRPPDRAVGFFASWREFDFRSEAMSTARRSSLTHAAW